VSTAESIIAVVIMVGLFLFAILAVPQFFLKRAIRDIVRMFRAHNATDPASAKTLDELGFKSRGMMENVFRGRDYKPNALNILVKSQIVIMTEDERYYLSEETLAIAPLTKSLAKPDKP
jgi:hypothetical protein